MCLSVGGQRYLIAVSSIVGSARRYRGRVSSCVLVTHVQDDSRWFTAYPTAAFPRFERHHTQRLGITTS